MKKYTAVGLVLLSFYVTGCGAKESSEVPASGPSDGSVSVAAPVAGQKTVDAAVVATVKGKVLFEGTAPAPKELSVKGNPECAVLHPGGTIASEELVVNNGTLQNVFVYVKSGLEGYTFTPPASPAVIENKTCMYFPHVSGVMVGQPVQFLNADSTLHNVHSYSKVSKSFNLGLPLVGMKQVKKFDAPEVMVSLKCDVHPWMQGYIGVLPHPYFSVTDAKGQFELKNLPPGEYTIEAWHEKLGVQEQKITVAANDFKDIEFKFQG